MINIYTPIWFETFLQTITPTQTIQEVAFLQAHLPQPAYQQILDVGCGLGRHAEALAAAGYAVTGIDLNARILAAAQQRSQGRVRYVAHDMRQIAQLPQMFDGILIMWQSFGYFGEATNTNILTQIYEQLQPQGRLILDVYHREFFEAHQGTYQFERNGLAITSTQLMVGPRYRVRLDYGPDHAQDTFEWQLYTPIELQALTASLGFSWLLACTNFDPQQLATPQAPRMQVVLQKPR
jgi:SAM-dependent methyltransferase